MTLKIKYIVSSGKNGYIKYCKLVRVCVYTCVNLNSNSKSLFYKDCSSGLVKTCLTMRERGGGGEGEREREGGGAQRER